MLDPQKLTPEGLYALQSDTWTQGVEWERARRLEFLKRVQTWYPDKSNVWLEGYEAAQVELSEVGVSRDYYAGRQRGLAEGREQEQERIADNLRDRAADLVADGDMASAELTLLSQLIDWLEGEQK